MFWPPSAMEGEKWGVATMGNGLPSEAKGIVMMKFLRTIRKSLWLTGAALLAVAATASIALAAVNVKSEPTASFSGASVSLTGGEFSESGNVEAMANVTATG